MLRGGAALTSPAAPNAGSAACGPDSPRSAAWFLVEAELVSHRIREHSKCAHTCADIRTRRQDAATGGLDPLQGVDNDIDQDVDPRPFVRSPIALLDPG